MSVIDMYNFKYKTLVLAIVLLGSVCEAARILAVFPTPSISHHLVFRPLTHELAKRGHDVVVITTDPAFPKGQSPEGLTEIDTHDISYKVWTELISSSTLTQGKSNDVITQTKTFFPLLSKIYESQMLTEEVQQVIDNKTNHFDLLLIEACVRPGIAISHIFKAPVILDMKSYLDSSKHGVIYISFGTNVNPSSLPSERTQLLVNVFSKLPYDVLWKWDQDELPGRSANIRIFKWLPQSDLLKHPKLKLFITQGGLQSTDEAITAGVPLIGMPMLGDQWYNVEQYVYHNIGIRLDMETLTEEKFLNGINTIVNDDRYRASVARLRGVMRDQPQAPLARAVWWAEHVLRHGGAGHLRARAANMGWPRYLDAELAAAAAAAAALAAALYLLLRILATTLATHTKIKKS